MIVKEIPRKCQINFQRASACRFIGNLALKMGGFEACLRRCERPVLALMCEVLSFVKPNAADFLTRHLAGEKIKRRYGYLESVY
jgi:hypothetical protein